MKEMKILHVINLDTIGGVEELFVHFLEKASQASPLKHIVLVAGGKIHKHFEKRIQKYAHCIIYEKFFLGLKIPKFLRQLKRKFAFRGNLQTVLLWNRFDDVQPFAKEAKVIYYEHGASWMHTKTQTTPKFFARVNEIIANSHAAKEVIKQKWQTNLPIHLVENPLRPDITFSKKPKSLPPAPYHIGFIGRLIPLKGVPLLLHAAKELQQRGINFKLSIAGSGQEKNSLVELAKKLQLEESVSFLGNIKDVASYYDSLDFLVMPSLREPLGLVALEASSRGLPVIASHVDGLSEVVVSEKNGISIPPTLTLSEYKNYGGENKGLPDLVFDPQERKLSQPKLVDPKKIAESIEYLILRQDLYTTLSQNAIECAKVHPNFDAYVQKLLTFIS